MKTVRTAERFRQDGQAVVWFLATIAACCCIFALVYNVGQVSNKKEATVNAADAAALSGALIEARMLNFTAYANRAAIANEVTIAQLVASESFMHYSDTLLQNIATYTSIVPYVDDVTSALADGADAATDAVDGYVQAGVPAIDAVVTALQGTATAAYGAGATAANTVASNIAAANVTTFNGRTDQAPQLAASSLALAMNEGAWTSFINTGGNLDVVSSIVQNSRDPFSDQRKNSQLINDVNTALEVLGGGTEFTQLAKTSGTTVLQGFNHWESQDSMDLEQSTCLFGLFCSTDPIPFVDMGYGRADADSNGDSGQNLCNTSGGIFGQYTWNCQQAMNNPNNVSWNGLPSLYDIAAGLSTTDPCSTNNGSDSASLTYVMAVQETGSAALTTQSLGTGLNNVDVSGPQGSPQMTDDFQNGGNITAISEACVFFLRPDGKGTDPTRGPLPRQDGTHEFASLYNPYWQARLTPPDSKWITALYTQIGQASLIPVATQ